MQARSALRVPPAIARGAMRHALLTDEMEDAWTYLHSLLRDLSDREFFWEPVADCWTIRRTPNGAWTYDYQLPPPQPAPVTTIGWRLIHLASCKVMYHEYAFGRATLTFPELVIPHTAADAVAWLEYGHGLLRSALAACTESALDEPVLTNWGERLPAWRIFWILLKHDIQHGGEIGCLRDLYRLHNA